MIIYSQSSVDKKGNQMRPGLAENFSIIGTDTCSLD